MYLLFNFNRPCLVMLLKFIGKKKSANRYLIELTFEPLTKNNRGKFIQLFGDKDTCSNCWCIY
jgi:hypothetical protein